MPKGIDAKKVNTSTVKSLGDWQKLGFVRVNGEPFPRPGDKATFFAPAGPNGPCFLLLNNFRAILHYNTANSYALAVGHLADRLAVMDRSCILGRPTRRISRSISALSFSSFSLRRAC